MTQYGIKPRPKGGFYWWFLWIAISIGSFIFSAIFWTWFLNTLFGEVRGTLMTLLWTGAVFASWLLTMIPIIRAKERYWNRLSSEDETHVTWWIGWMALTIASFFASAGFWTWFLAKNGGSVQNPATAKTWIFAVFGTWMVALVPLIVTMYQKVDRAYEKAREARERREESEPSQPRPKSIYLDPAKRSLDENLVRKLKRIPVTLKRGRDSGHLVTAVLKDGRKFQNVFVANGRELLGIYDYHNLPFEAKDIIDLEPADLDKVPAFSEQNWLRLDGRN